MDPDRLLRPAGPIHLLQTALQELSEMLTNQKRHEEAIALLREALGASTRPYERKKRQCERRSHHCCHGGDT
jgi:hypothetical protein